MSVVSVVITTAIAITLHYHSIESSRRVRHVARARPIPYLTALPVTFAEGTNLSFASTPGDYYSSVAPSLFEYRILDDLTLLVAGDLRDATDSLLLEAIGSEIRVLPSSGHDVNSDRYAIEVVDRDLSPVFQLQVLPGDQYVIPDVDKTAFAISVISDAIEALENSGRDVDRLVWINSSLAKAVTLAPRRLPMRHAAESVIQVNYAYRPFDGDNSWQVITPTGTYSSVTDQDARILRRTIPRLFEYPGHLNPGVRVASHGSGSD